MVEARARAARRGRNPQTGAEIQIAETVVPAFSAGGCCCLTLLLSVVVVVLLSALLVVAVVVGLLPVR